MYERTANGTLHMSTWDTSADALIREYQEARPHGYSRGRYVMEVRVPRYQWACMVYGKPIVGYGRAMRLVRELVRMTGQVWRVRSIGPTKRGNIWVVTPEELE